MIYAPDYIATLTTGNAAFDENPPAELARVFRALADKIERQGPPPADNFYILKDANGNSIGEFRPVGQLADEG